MDPIATQPKDFAENTLFWINNDFAIVKNGKVQRRGKVSGYAATRGYGKMYYRNLWLILRSDKSNWASAAEYRAVAARGQPIDCAIANTTHTGSDYQNNENEEKIEQRSLAGSSHHSHSPLFSQYLVSRYCECANETIF